MRPHVVAFACLASGALAAATLAAPSIAAGPAAPPSPRSVVPSTWEPLAPAGPRQPDPSHRVDLTRSPDGIAHIVWVVGNADGTSSLRERRLTPIGAGGDDLVDGFSTPAASWLLLGDPAGVDVGNGYQLYFGGQQSGAPDSLIGLEETVNTGPNLDPQWSTPYTVEPGQSALWAEVAQAPVLTPVLLYEQNSTVVADRPGDVTPPAVVPSSGGTDGAGSIVIDPTNSSRAAVAWCEFGGPAPGAREQVYDAISGGFVGSPARMPGTAGACNLQASINRATPLAVRGSDVYLGGTHLNASTGTLTEMRVWRVGDAEAEVVGRSTTGLYAPQLVADTCGRLWAGWVARRGGVATLLVRRTDVTATRWGATVAVEPPSGWTLGSFEAIASCVRGPGQLDVVGEFEKPGKNILQHTIVQPGLTLTVVRVERLADGSKRVTYLVSDAGSAVGGARVSAHGVSATTGSDGKATLRFTGDTSATVTRAGYSDGHS